MSERKRFQLTDRQIEEYLAEARQIIRQMKPRVRRHFPALARQWHEDALGHVWLKLKKGAFDPSRPFAPWCQRVLRNFKFDAGRCRCRRDRVFENASGGNGQAELRHVPDGADVVRQLQRQEANVIYSAKFSPQDLASLGDLDLLTRVAALCRFNLWHKVPRDLWRRWCRQLETEYALRDGLPLEEVRQADDSRRHRILAQALNIRSNTLLQKIIRARRQLARLAFFQQLEQAI